MAVSSGNAHPMTLYFPNAAASLNVPVTRYGLEVPTLSGAVEALLDGPAADGLRVPRGNGPAGSHGEDGIAGWIFLKRLWRWKTPRGYAPHCKRPCT